MRNLQTLIPGQARRRASSRFLFLVLAILAFSYFASPVEASGASGETPVAEAAHGAPAAGGHGGEAKAHEPGLFDVNPWILFSQVVNFFVLLWLMNRFLYGPINDVLEARRKKITDTLDSAAEENRKAGELRTGYEKKLAQVEQESSQIKQKAIIEAQSARDEILGSARTKSAELVEKAHQEIMMEKKKAWADLREEVVRLSLLVAERVIEKSLDAKAHQDLIDKAIDGLERRE